MTKEGPSVSIHSDDGIDWFAMVYGVDYVYGQPIQVRKWEKKLTVVCAPCFCVQFELTKVLVSRCIDDRTKDVAPCEWEEYLALSTHPYRRLEDSSWDLTDYANEFKFCCVAATAAIKAVYKHRAMFLLTTS